MSFTTKTVASASVLAAAAGVFIAVAPSASAATNPNLRVTYDAVGSSTVKKTGSVVPLGPTTLATSLAPDGSFIGVLPLTPQQTSFKLLGLLPVKATVTFLPTAKVRGALHNTAGRSFVTSTATYTIQLSNVTVAGLPAFVGNSCKTAAPVTIALATPADQSFDLTNGGVVSGTFTIGNFANCGLTTTLINQLIPGPDNAASVTLSNGRLGS